MSSKQPITRADAEGSSPVWLLELDWGGRVYRLATEPVAVPDGSGGLTPYSGGLEDPGGLSASLGRLETDPGDRSATIRCFLEQDVAKRVAQGHDLLTASATLYLGTVAVDDYRPVPVLLQDRENMWHQITGLVSRPSFADPDAEPGALAFTIEESPWDLPGTPLCRNFIRKDVEIEGDDGRTVLAQGVVKSALGGIPSTQDDVVDAKVAPIVIGRPGSLEAFVTPGYLVGAWNTLYSGGSAVPGDYYESAVGNTDLSFALLISEGPVDASQVRRYGENSSDPENPDVRTLNVYTVIGDDGVAYAMADQGPYVYGMESHKAYCSFNTGGGILSPFSGGELRSSAEVVAWALNRSGYPVDVGAWLALPEHVSFPVDTYLNDAKMTGWEFIESNGILELMGVGIKRTPKGLAPVSYDPDVYRSQVVTTLEEGIDWAAVSAVTTETELAQIVNSTEVQYLYDGRNDGPAGAVQVGPVAGQATRKEIERSISRYGTREAAPIDASITTDRAAAAVIGMRSLRLQCLPTVSRSYFGGWELGWLEVGDAVAVTDEQCAWYERVGVLMSKEWTGEGFSFTVLLEEEV